MPNFSPELRRVIVGNPWGEVHPSRPPPPPPPYDGRTAALRVLKKYISELTFFRSGGVDGDGTAKDPIPFQIATRDIHVEWPDDEATLRLPSIALLGAGAPADYDNLGMTTNVEEDSVGKYGPGTVLIDIAEHTENVAIEIWAETKPQRRAILAGLEQALSPLEQMAGIRFRCPDYYDQFACFSMNTKEYVDDETAVFARRKARIVAQLRIKVVRLVNVEFLNPVPTMVVDANEDTGEPVDLEGAGSPPDPSDL